MLVVVVVAKQGGMGGESVDGWLTRALAGQFCRV